MAIVVLVVFRHGISSIQCLQVLGSLKKFSFLPDHLHAYLKMSQPTPDKCYSLPRSIAVQIKFIDLQVEFTSTGCVD